MPDKMPDKLAELAIKMLGDRWKVLIIKDLLEGTKRFGDLRILEEKGLLVRKVYAQIPPRVDYTLTQLGYELKPVIDSMIAWAETYYNDMAKMLNIDTAKTAKA